MMVQYFCLFDLRAWATCSEVTDFGCLYACRCLRGSDEVPPRCPSYLWPCSLVARSCPRCGQDPSALRLCCFAPCWFRPSASPLPVKCSPRCLCLSVSVFMSLSVRLSVSLSVSVSLSLSLSLCLSLSVLVYGSVAFTTNHMSVSVCLSFSPSQSLCIARWPSQ